jgi:eukaryotic-like serine/threonine-protein kinase
MIAKLDAETWSRLSPYLDRALEMAVDARTDWLAQLDSTDPDLAAALRRLLIEKDQLEASGFLTGSAPGPLGSGTLAGQRIGAYQIEELIGQGGMGNVWLASRRDGRFDGRAAVKLLNVALIGGPAEQRFAREGSVLAALQQPNIARLIDAGVTAGGQPYLILEHVEGEPIDRYCEERALDVAARLRLFLDVLEAVAHAHSHLVVHRDLKPSNILVTHAGVVKLLDFGIAALLQSDPGARGTLALTREMHAALTPEYAAPEQLTGQPVTTATDIYALGLVLYALLTGRPAAIASRAAHDLKQPHGGEWPAPSATVPERALQRQLRGDLDNIVAKSVRRNPLERYATVAAFGNDLRRYLRHEPVSARPDSLGYRARKFIRRHRGGVLTGAFTALAVMSSLGFAVWQMFDAQRQRDVAREQARRAEGFSTAVTGLLSQVGPGGRALEPVELLDRAVEQVKVTYADDPAFVVNMLSILSGRYFDLRDTNREYATLLEAERIAREAGDPALIVEVQCNTVETELQAGRPTAAERRMAEARELIPGAPELPVLTRAACLRAEAEIARARDALPDALRHLEAARHLLRSAGRTRGNVYSGMLSMLSSYSALAGDPVSGYRHSLELLEVDAEVGRQHSLPGLIARAGFAVRLCELGQVKRALEVFDQIIAERRESGSDGLPSGLGEGYAEILSRAGRYDAALPLLTRAVTDADQSGNRAAAMGARLALARSYVRSGEFANAAVPLTAATSLMANEATANRAGLGDADTMRAEQLLAEDHLAEADAAIDAALERYGDPQAGRGPRIAGAWLVRARIRLAQGRADAAIDSAAAAVRLYEAHTIDAGQSADVGEALLALAQAQIAAGRLEEARRSLERAAACLRNGLGPDHVLTVLAGRLRDSLG